MAIAKSSISRLSLVLPLLIWGFAAKIASAQTGDADAGSLKFTTLHSFSGSEGENPNGVLLQATNGDFYGTTVNAGARCILPTTDCGTIFKITPSGGLTAIHSFCFGLCASDGSAPDGLVQATNGYLYGTTTFGGANCPPNGCGTIFKISPSGTLTTLYSFCSISGCPDGYAPLGLVQASNGDLYGTTGLGGIATSCSFGCGTIFKVTSGGTLTTVYTFCAKTGCPDGSNPYPGLVEAANGDYYGATSNGGITNSYCPLGCGTVFKITPTGAFTTLYSFCSQPGCADGGLPAKLAQGANGDLYGATARGGSSNCAFGCGTIFQLSPSGALTTIYSFCSQNDCVKDDAPSAQLIQTDGDSLYGWTAYGGAYGYGSIFKITPSGTYTTLYSFCSHTGCPDGATPDALVEGTNGIFYGTTYSGGATGYGTVFRFSTVERRLWNRDPPQASSK
jgi:uncharacterized repeat protein (TIGR03803 family)